MCDRWFGHLMESLRTTGVLDDALVIVTSDHGHSLWERRGYIGKRGYPSDPESYEVPLLVRHPQKLGAGTGCNALVQHHDIAATLLEAAGVSPREAIDGRSFWATAFEGGPPIRDHVTVGWGSAMTVIDDRWWLNCKINGRGPFLYDSPRPRPDAPNLADRHPEVVRRLFDIGKADAGGRFPEYLLLQAEKVPPGQIRQKAMLDLSSKTGTYGTHAADPMYYPLYVSNKWVDPLDRYLNDPTLTDPAWFRYDDIVKAWRDADAVDGKPYGIPYDGEMTVQVYRTDLYDARGLKPADTLEQLVENAKAPNAPANRLCGAALRGLAGAGPNMR